MSPQPEVSVPKFIVLDTDNTPSEWRNRGAIILCRSNKDCNIIYSALQADEKCRNNIRMETLSVPNTTGTLWAIRFNDINTSNHVLGIVRKFKHEFIPIEASDDKGVLDKIALEWEKFRGNSIRSLLELVRHKPNDGLSSPGLFSN